MNRGLLSLACACLILSSCVAEDVPCTLRVGLPYETEAAVTATLPDGDVTCAAAPIDCEAMTFPEGAIASCQEPSAKIFKTLLTCTGPNVPADDEDLECSPDAIPLVYAAALEASKAEAFGADKPACMIEDIEFPLTVDHATHLDLSSLGLNTMCDVPESSQTGTCYGPSKKDCDRMAITGADLQLVMDSALGPLSDMPALEKKFHIHNALFWSIMGTIFTWIGFIMVLYAEIKAVVIVRERDERDRLIAAKIVKANPDKMKILLDEENGYFAIRPYVTILAFILFWVGLLFQFTPFCSFITLIFPNWFGVENACYIVVLAATIFFATSLFLMLLGLIWSCTRGWAALVLLVLGIVTNGLVFTGLIGLSIWAFFLVGLLLLWFKFLPDYFESKGERPDWLQDIGSFKIATSVEDIKAAGEGFIATANKDARTIPGVSEGMDAAQKATEAAHKAAQDAAAAAQKAAQDTAAAAQKAAQDTAAATQKAAQDAAAATSAAPKTGASTPSNAV